MAGPSPAMTKKPKDRGRKETNDRYRDKSPTFITYIFCLSEFVTLGPCGLARGSCGCLTSWLNHNRRARRDEGEILLVQWAVTH